MTTTTPLLAVFGATGAQGGSLIAYMLAHPSLSKSFKLRGVTRDIHKPASVALREKGVEMVQADMDDAASLRGAVAGSSAVFAVTNFWEKASAEVEIAQGKAVADAAVAEGVDLLIWSSLPHVSKMTDGKLRGVKHFDSKAEVEIYIRALPIKSAFYMPALYMQMMTSLFKPQMNSNGVLAFTIPWNEDTRIPLIDIADTGKFLAPVLSNPDKYNGASFTAATAFYTPRQMIEAWRTITGKDVVFVQQTSGSPMGPLSPEMLQSLRGLIGEYAYYGPSGKEDLAWTLAQMAEEPRSWRDFVEANEPWFEDA